MSVDAGYALRLKSQAAYVSTVPAGAPAWGERGVETETISPLALAADAVDEAQRQANFLGGPLAVDRHVVQGRRRDLMLKPTTVVGDRLGYESAPLVFVIGVVENGNGTSTLTVLKRLP